MPSHKIESARILVIAPRFDKLSGGDGLYAHILTTGLRGAGLSIDVLSILNSRFVLNRVIAGQETPIELGEVEMGVLGHNFYSGTAGSAVAKALEMVRPTLVHIHGIHQYFTISAARILRTAHVPMLATVHDYKFFCGNAGFFSDRRMDVCFRCLDGSVMPAVVERCKRGSLFASTGAFVQMEAWKTTGLRDIVSMYHCPSKYVFDLLGTNAQLEDKRAYVRYPNIALSRPVVKETEHMSVVYFGRMVPHKGARIFAQAVQGLDIPVEVFGDGPELEDVKRLLGGHGKATIHGWQSRAEISANLHPGTIVVLPYLAPETFCFAVLEAMAAGACVVSTRRGAIPELIDHGRTGILVDPPAPDAFRSTVMELLSDQARVRSIGSAAAQSVTLLPSEEDHLDAMLQLYSSMLGYPGSRQSDRRIV